MKMPVIHLTTFIAAPPQRVFDLSRSVELHKYSMSKYREEAVAGTRFGLLEKDDTVTWKAKHLMKERVMRVRISSLNKYESFTDEQVEGSFASMKHDHFFKPIENGTILIDKFEYKVPYGGFGNFINNLFLQRYIKKLLTHRNQVIKEFAEGEQWKRILEK